MKKFSTEINYQATKELTHKNLVLYSILLCVAIAGFVALITTTYLFNQMKELWFIPVLVINILLLILSSFYVVAVNIARRRSKDVHLLYNYEFHQEMVNIYAVSGNQKTTLKVAYSDIKFYRESKNYYFLYLDARHSFPLEKKDGIDEVASTISLHSIHHRKF